MQLVFLMVRLLTAGRRATAGAAFSDTGALAGAAATGIMQLVIRQEAAIAQAGE